MGKEKQSPVEILYANSIKQREKEKREQEEKNKLLGLLGDRLTPAQKLYSTVDELRQKLGAIGDFKRNYHDIKEANTKLSDKYFHAKANCQAAQRGQAGADIARGLSDLRENTDLIKNQYKKKKDGTKMKPSEIIEDYRDDHYANLYGRLQGLQNPNTDCRILVDKYRPKGLNKKY